MFDDQQKPQQPTTGVPPNLPMDEPEDIFDDTDAAAPAVPDVPKLGEIDNSGVPAAPPNPPSAPPVAPPAMPPIAPPPAMPPIAPPVIAPSAVQPPDQPLATALDAGVLKPVGEAVPLAAPQIPRTPAASPAPEEPLDDPFAETDPVAAPPATPPATPTPPTTPAPAQEVPQASATPTTAGGTMFGDTGGQPEVETAPQEINQDGTYTIKGPVLSRGIMTIIIVIIVVLGIGGGFWWVYNTFIVNNENLEEPYVQESAEEAPAQDSGLPDGVFFEDEGEEEKDLGEEDEAQEEEQEENTLDATPTEQEVDNTILFGQAVDTDGDGLDDEREVRLGLDPQNWDTDYDALSDGDEVIIWKTDPLNKDTDGDSYPDGLEVQTGHSPIGPGKLFDKEEENTTSSEDQGEVPVLESDASPDSTAPEELPTAPDDTEEEVGEVPEEPSVEQSPVVEEEPLNLPLEATVSISAMKFASQTVVVSVGGTVTWMHDDTPPHDVTSDGNFASSILNAGDTFSQTFTEPGTYNYYCSVHPGMRGTVIVQ